MTIIPSKYLQKLCPAEFSAFAEAVDYVSDNADTNGFTVHFIFLTAVRQFSATKSNIDMAERLHDSMKALRDALKEKEIDARPGLVDTETELSIDFYLDSDKVFERKLSKYGRQLSKTLGMPVAEFTETSDPEVFDI